MTEIDAFIYDKKIGTMIDDGNTIWFEYDDDFRKYKLEISPIGMPLRLTSPFTNKSYPRLFQGLQGVFFDSLPDKHGMPFIDRYFERQGKRPFEVGLLDKLSFIGDRGMGAIEYRPQEEDGEHTQDVSIDAKEAYEQMKEDLQNDEPSIESIMNIRDSVSPIGGGRPKMLVQYNYNTGEIRLNKKELHDGYERAIIKFDDLYEGMGSDGATRLEYVCMFLAGKAGINTADFHLMEDSEAKHLLVKRFDRDKEDRKIHMCTASGLMNVDITIPQVISYEQLLMLTRSVCKSQEDVEEMYRRMIFNILIFNFDDHAKNFAYLMDKDGNWKISPAYDITYSKGLAKQHTTTVSGKGLRIKRHEVLEIAARQTIKNTKAKMIIEDCIRAVVGFKELAYEVGLDEDEVEMCWTDIVSQIELLRG
ncbi:hypothetical protein CP985_14140 [Malaciobacter mytili LMG 24559]|uniref:Toxin-antitoxin system, toxin component, HipA family n=1 Tax=Malaciobacter mytili LMG 24559 TaxID=1032238 RepID=A0AAX2AEA4_9BACT|nr:type II toxin-antitoxin system HipA family toxin [Malaciobacter mytili]AXH16475.1 toxin-antitoxin system, toxin component, HipA family [Malaciobacter mytili LMG 24559]RXK12887.1 hypothetical protein CP985_14140 [Malaciobacter mytili LMG 24559]